MAEKVDDKRNSNFDFKTKCTLNSLNSFTSNMRRNIFITKGYFEKYFV